LIRKVKSLNKVTIIKKFFTNIEKEDIQNILIRKTRTAIMKKNCIYIDMMDYIIFRYFSSIFRALNLMEPEGKIIILQ